MATVLFSIPIHFWAVSVVVLFMGTIAITYTLCIHEGVCPKLPQLPTISGTWVTPPGNYLSRVTVSIGCTMFMFGNIVMYWINQLRRSPSATGPSNEVLLWMAQIGVFCLSWVGAICDSKTPTCNGNGHLHTFCALIFFFLYDLYLYFICHMKTHNESQQPAKWAFAVLGLSIISKIRFVPFLFDWWVNGNETALAYFEWTDVTCINLLVIHFMWPYTQFGVGVVSTGSSSSDAQSSSSEKGVQEDDKMLMMLEADRPPSRWNSRGSNNSSSQPRQQPPREATVLTAWTADQWVRAVFTLAAFTLLSTWAVAVHNGSVPKDKLPEVGATWIKSPGDWLARWGVMMTSSALTIMHCMTYQMRATLFGARAVPQTNYFCLLLQLVSFIGSLCLGLSGVIDELENAPLHRHCSDAFYLLYSFYMIGSLMDALVVGHTGCSRVLLMLAACAASLWAKLRMPFVAHHLHHYLCSPAHPSAFCNRLADRTGADSDVPALEWLDILSIAVFTVAAVYARPAPEGRQIVWAIFRFPAQIRGY